MLLHTHTHPFNGPFSGTTQKGKTNLDFTEARDSEWQWHQLGRMQVCTSLQTDNHASTPPLIFLQAGCPSCHPTNSVKALKADNCPIFKCYITREWFALCQCGDGFAVVFSGQGGVVHNRRGCRRRALSALCHQRRTAHPADVLDAVENRGGTGHPRYCFHPCRDICECFIIIIIIIIIMPEPELPWQKSHQGCSADVKRPDGLTLVHGWAAGHCAGT